METPIKNSLSSFFRHLPPKFHFLQATVSSYLFSPSKLSLYSSDNGLRCRQLMVVLSDMSLHTNGVLGILVLGFSRAVSRFSTKYGGIMLQCWA